MYVVLNPVRARMVNDVADLPWSNYLAEMNQAAPLKCLKVYWLLSQFGSDKERARVHYQNFVRAGIGLPPVWDKLHNQIFLGSQDFVDKMQSLIKVEPHKLNEIPKAQHKTLGKPLDYYVEALPNSKEGMKKAYETGDYTMQQIADAFGVHYSTVSRAVHKTSLKNS